jgi:hypothetical protein
VEQYRERLLRLTDEKKYGSGEQGSIKNLRRKRGKAMPELKAVEDFYTKLFTETKRFNPRDETIRQWGKHMKERVNESEPREDEIPEELFSKANWADAVRKTKNNGAPGRDGIIAKWWKCLPVALEDLRISWIKMMLQENKTPSSWIMGRSCLIYKDKGDEAEVCNYRPITCANVAYKFGTKTVKDHFDRHFGERLGHKQQYALTKGEWGCQHALVIDKATQVWAMNGNPLSIAWLDIAKAFDTMSHKLIIYMLRAAKVDDFIVDWLEMVMPKWATVFAISGADGSTQTTKPVQFGRGVFQGDSLSPTLFCIAMLILQFELDSKHTGITLSRGIKTGIKLTHGVYMDDAKLVAPDARSLANMLEGVEQVMAEIGMSLNKGKCAQMHYGQARKKIVKFQCSWVRELETGESYKYLGIEQNAEFRFDTNIKTLIAKCIDETREIMATRLLAQKKIRSFNQTVPAFVRYVVRSGQGAGRYEQLKGEMEGLDKKIRHELCVGKLRGKGQARDELYIKSSRGGLGIACMAVELAKSTAAMYCYLHQGPKEIRRIRKVYKDCKSEGIVDDMKLVCKQYKIKCTSRGRTLTINGTPTRTLKKSCKLLSEAIEKHAQLTREKRFFKRTRMASKMFSTHPHLARQVGVLIRQSSLTASMVRDVLQIRGQSLRVEGHPGWKGERKCVYCGYENPSNRHLLGSCEGTKHAILRRHNKVALIIYNAIGTALKDEYQVIYGDTAPPPRIDFDGDTYMTWDFPVITNVPVDHNKPDLVLVTKQYICIIEVGICFYDMLLTRAKEKSARYKILAEQLARENPDKVVTIVPVIYGYIGESETPTLKNLKALLKELGVSDFQRRKTLMRCGQAAISGSTQIVRNWRLVRLQKGEIVSGE